MASKMDIIEKKYGKDSGMRSAQKLCKYLEDKNYSSLSNIFKIKLK